LKELDLKTIEKPCPVYLSSLFTPEEQKEYFNLLSDYKDVFAWSYTEIPGLDLKVTVHRLSLRRGVSPKK